MRTCITAPQAISSFGMHLPKTHAISQPIHPGLWKAVRLGIMRLAAGPCVSGYPTRTVEVRSELVPTAKYELYWSALEVYHPRFADELAKFRESWERGKAEREKKRWQEENPLLTWAEREEAEKGGQSR